MRIALASDHAGYAEKERLKGLLGELLDDRVSVHAIVNAIVRCVRDAM